MNNIIKKALISEKSFKSAAEGKYTFLVAKSADKEAVAKACENLFGVTVLSANSMNYKGKVKMTKRVKGKRADFKKVVLTLKKGQKIDLFEMEAPEDKAAAAKEEKKTKAKKADDKVVENKDVEVKIKTKK